jgi:hypothetical protein
MRQIQDLKIFPVDALRSAVERRKVILGSSSFLAKLLDSFAFHYHNAATGFDLTLQSHLLVLGSRSWTPTRHPALE